MTSGDTKISGAGKKRLRRGCIWTLLIFVVGFYAGLAATKRALTGLDWVRRVAGITIPAPPITPPQNPPPTNANQMPQYGKNNSGGANNTPAPAGVNTQPAGLQGVTSQGSAMAGAQSQWSAAPAR